MILHVVSMSGGKDSTATAILALETMPRESLRFVFADTGNEHELTYRYIDYLRRALDIEIDVVRADLSADLARKRDYILEKWPGKGVPADVVERAAAAMVPSGNPYLDMCVMKGRFPARMSQFCTDILKTQPIVEYQLNLLDSGQAQAVWSWQGVRIDESHARAKRLSIGPWLTRHFEAQGGEIYTYRPILRWTSSDVFEAHRVAGIDPNPLYRMGMTRVGCMPCVNASKDELLEISKRFPAEIDRIERWEAAVKLASKRGDASFFPDPIRQEHLGKRGIRAMVGWSQTSRGGKNIDMLRILPSRTCESAYGLCE